MAPWLIVTAGWPAAGAAAGLLARATGAGTDALVTATLVLGGGALLGLRALVRPRRRSTS